MIRKLLVMWGILAVALCVVIWAFHSMKESARKDCAKHSATAHFTSQVQYICVTSDGKIVG